MRGQDDERSFGAGLTRSEPRPTPQQETLRHTPSLRGASARCPSRTRLLRARRRRGLGRPFQNPWAFHPRSPTHRPHHDKIPGAEQGEDTPSRNTQYPAQPPWPNPPLCSDRRHAGCVCEQEHPGKGFALFPPTHGSAPSGKAHPSSDPHAPHRTRALPPQRDKNPRTPSRGESPPRSRPEGAQGNGTRVRAPGQHGAFSPTRSIPSKRSRARAAAVTNSPPQPDPHRFSGVLFR